MTDSERPVYVGAHVIDREDDTPRVMVVTARTEHVAREYQLDDTSKTVADVNESYPETDPVVEVKYPVREAQRLGDLKEYAFPVSRLEVVSRVHDRGEERRVEYDVVAGWAAHALQGASNKYGVDSSGFAGALYALGITLGAHDPARQTAPHGTIDDTRDRLLDAAGIDADRLDHFPEGDA